MNIFLWLLLLTMIIISFIPITRIQIFDLDEKYKNFKYVSIFLFLWSILAFLNYICENPYIVYFLHLAIYPLIFLLTSSLFVAFARYIDILIPKSVKIVLGLIFIIDLVLAFTNTIHMGFISIPFDSNLTLALLEDVPHGLYFMIHTIICYVILLFSIIMILSRLYKNYKLDQDIMPLMIMFIGIVTGVTLNAIHIFVQGFLIDPTYVAFVVLISLLYFVLYIRDIKIILALNRNNLIIDNLREMYVITNHRGIVESASEEFIKSFNIKINKDLNFDKLMDNIKEKAFIYENQLKIENKYVEDKKYLHMQKKPIDLPFFKYKGSFYLFYDESINRKYINELDYVKSHDLMTGLYNRNYFEEIKHKIDSSNDFFTLIMFDLDCLKFYNDYLGHKAGDDLIVRFSNKLITVAKDYNMTPIRLGGDEFLLIAINTESKIIEQAIKRVKSLSDTKLKENRIIFSYGIASKSNDFINLEGVFSEADKQMYSMKSKKAKDKADLENNLRNLAKK